MNFNNFVHLVIIGKCFVCFSLVCNDIAKRFTKKLAKSVENNFKVLRYLLDFFLRFASLQW